MDKNTEDRRTRKTSKAIQEALFSLMTEKQYHKITIQDIIDRADVGRATFYSHYPTKDDLLIRCIEHLLVMVKDYVASYLEHEGDKSRILPVTGLFEHVKENSRIIKGLLNSDKSDLFFAEMQKYCNESIIIYFTNRNKNLYNLKVPETILANHISGTVINLLKWWIQSNMPFSPSEMDSYFQELINPCIDSVLSITSDRI